jgi:adhesin HecA-like repeat protein
VAPHVVLVAVVRLLPLCGAFGRLLEGDSVKSNRVTRACAVLLSFTYAAFSALPLAVAAPAPPPASSTGANMNLGSSAATMTAPSASVIRTGDAVQAIHAGQAITPAQYAALSQVLSGGMQHLNLDLSGRAVGGYLGLNTVTAQQQLGSLSVPKNVTVINDFAHAAALTLLGDLINSGKFYAVSSSSDSQNANISANNIFNNSGALLTSVLPSAGLPGYANAIHNLSLNLTAQNNLVNAGTISSAGNLSVTAGGAITNSGVMSAANGSINFNRSLRAVTS